MNQPSQQLIKASVIIVIIAGVLGVLTILAGDIGPATGKIFSLCFSLIILGITATISMVVSRKPEYKGLGIAGMLTSAITYALLLLIVIAEVTDVELLKLTFTLFIASIGLAHICLLHHFTLQNKYALYARITATIAIAIFTLILVTRVFEPFPSLYNLAYTQSALKLLGASFIIDLSATLLVPLCNRLHTSPPDTETFSFDKEEVPSPEKQDPII